MRVASGPAFHTPHGARRGTAPLGLRVASHNVSGIDSPEAACALVRMWHAARLDVICVQETWVGRPGTSGRVATQAEVELWLTAACAAQRIQPYDVYWAHNSTDHSGNAGVAIFVRGTPGLEVRDHVPSPCGRLQRATVSWGGHTFTLVNTYWPATGAPARATFLSSSLAPFLTAEGADPGAHHPLCIAGDFNFTVLPALDRRPQPSADTAASDHATSLLFSTAFPSLVDTHRRHHPRGSSATLHRGTRIARLDRIHWDAALAPYSFSSTIIPSPRGDHHAVCTHLLPAAAPEPRGPGRRPLPSGLASTPQTGADLLAYAHRAASYISTLPGAQVIAAWPRLIAGYIQKARDHGHHAHHTRQAAARTDAAVAAAVDAALRRVEVAPAHELPRALQMASDALSALREHAAAASGREARALRASWVSERERPSPALTAFMAPRRGAMSVPALRSRDGALLTTNLDIANGLTAHFAAVSAAPDIDPAARRLVVDAVAADVARGDAVRPIPPELAAAAGAPEITEEEVREAMQYLATESSPGPDGLPFDLWMIGDGAWAPTLAKFYSALGHAAAVSDTPVLPPGFNLGTITPLLKPGANDTTAAASYRPITLLPTVYRILATVLERRFARAMAPAIGPEQSAFLPGRRIEDAINTISLLPQAVAASGESAANIYLDISKAFDTVYRPLIYDVMRAMNASEGMITWARVMLHNTEASTNVNGVESATRAWHAGVRQGCPLSPLLYVFVSQAFASWLRAQPELGVMIDGRRYVITAYADDSTIHQGDLSDAALTALERALRTFERATGQRVNLPKSLAMLIGRTPRDPPPTLAGVPVRDHTISLGVPQHNPPLPPEPTPHAYATRGAARLPVPTALPPLPPHIASFWNDKMTRVNETLRRVAHLPCSAMGRGMAATTYALSRCLYHAEFSGTPPGALADLFTQAARVVAPDVPPGLVTGSPLQGGFGLLHPVFHTHARRAQQALRLVAATLDPAPTHTGWTHLATFLLQRAFPTLHPAHAILLFTTSSFTAARAGVLGIPGIRQDHPLPAGPLTRLASALSALGPFEHLATSDLPTALNTAAPSPILHELQWARPASPGVPSMLAHPVADSLPPVSTLTRLQCHQMATARAARHAAFVQEAAHGSSTVTSTLLATFPASLRHAWRLPCDNAVKETFWRLAINAVPGFNIRPWLCPCASTPFPSPRVHAFWECPVAVQVRAQLASGIGFTPSRQSVWLLSSPPPRIPPPLWRLVCIASIYAMDVGRRRLWALFNAPSPPGIADRVAAASNVATLHFWTTLRDVVRDQSAIVSDWLLSHDSPFLALRDGRVVVNMPIA